MHSDLPAIGRFETSEPTVMALEEMTRRADETNFFFFPTDCPQREKNGWTADASLSAVQLLYKYDASRSWREWLRNIRAAMREDGSIPGIVPTAGWGYHWGNGPAWDSVLIELPYRLYTLRGDTEVIRENATAFVRYLTYVRGRRDERGLLSIGLGDWVAQRRPYQSPLIFTDTVVMMDLAKKAYEMLSAVGLNAEAALAHTTYLELREAARLHLVDLRTMVALGNCQTSQAMAIYYGVFNEAEAALAFKVLLDIIAADDERIMAGVLGARVLLRVLGDFGETELAWRMITDRGRCHYGEWVEKGLTALAESFFEIDQPHYVDSLNHHFWGDVSAFFAEYYAGVRYNPEGNDGTRLDVCPTFPKALPDASFTYAAPIGEIKSSWTRGADGVITLELSVPKTAHGFIKTPLGFRFENGMTVAALASGRYRIVGSSEG
jgi:alpha-L-rhamnosidase